MKHIIIGLFFLTSFSIFSQVKVGDNPNTINTNSILELETTNKGLLLPRVALSSTTLANPLAAHVEGMTVYNTATAGDVVPGYYYNNGTKWLKLIDENTKDNDWFVESTTNNPASINDNIYTNGNVGIGTNAPNNNLEINGGLTRKNSRGNNEKYPISHEKGDLIFGIDPTISELELQEVFNSTNATWTNDPTAPGGYCIHLNGPVNVGGRYHSGFPYIPVETSDVFYMECWIKNDGIEKHYMGSIDYGETFNELGGNPGTFGYWTMLNYNPGTNWVKVSGYIKGFGGSIGQFKNGTKYWTPQALFNYNHSGGTRACWISGWRVYRVSNPGIRTFNDKVGIGTVSPQGTLDVSSTTGALIVPRMTTAQRNALAGINGSIIYNTTTNQFNFYENGAWVTK